MSDVTGEITGDDQAVAASEAATDSLNAESNSLRWSMVFNVIMGIAGVTVAQSRNAMIRSRMIFLP